MKKRRLRNRFHFFKLMQKLMHLYFYTGDIVDGPMFGHGEPSSVAPLFDAIINQL